MKTWILLSLAGAALALGGCAHLETTTATTRVLQEEPVVEADVVDEDLELTVETP